MHGNFKDVSKNFRGALRKFHGCHREITRVFLECFTGVSSRLSQFQGCFIEVLRIFHRSFKHLTWEFQGSFREVLMIFHKKFQENVKVLYRSVLFFKVFCRMSLIAASRAEGGLVY